MRPRNQPARDQLPAALARHGPCSTSALAKMLDVSVPTVHRLLRECGPSRIVSAGRAGRTRYALRRPLRGDPADIPVYEVDAQGTATAVATLVLIEPGGSYCSMGASTWPVPEEARDGWWGGLPYPVYDMRPQGYMGRQLARAEANRLSVADNPEHWTDDDIVFVLARCGADTSGNLILGNPAYESWQRGKIAGFVPLRESDVGPAYAAGAERAIASGVPESSAAGEFPKFAAVRELAGCATPHVLVKFSGSDDSPAVRRWADLLVCEHLAIECAGLLPQVAGASTRIVAHAGRTFLEVERFDRTGFFGRRPLCSLETLNAAFIGSDSADWSVLAARLVQADLLDPLDARRIGLLWWYGRLIANTDMHLGNLSFRPGGRFELAPVYDMLPMHYAPLPAGELPVRVFDPPLPLPAQRETWRVANAAATQFWGRAAADPRISTPFRAQCGANAERLQALLAAV